MERAEIIASINAGQEIIRRNHLNKGLRIYESFYPWQRQFNAATKDYDACMLMAANQVGKSRTGCSIDSFHLTGDYPDDWEGHKFVKPPLCWLLGYSGEKTRDLLQTKLFGRYLENEFEGGFISKDKIIDHRAMTGTAGAMREVRVKHVNGIATCQFWSYTQGQHALMGDLVDWYHIDEEPKDPYIYPQVLTRTINGDQGRGGRGILTFTPENGKTQMVCQFMGEEYEGDEGEVELDTGMYLQGATWKQCPHITDEKEQKLLRKYPKYQREMRSKGTPLMGSGLIYEHGEHELSFKPFDYPSYWFVINGIDFGWDHPQAHIQLLWDKDADIFYLVNAWKASKKQPYEAWHVVKPWAKNVPTAWPQDGLQHKQQSSGEAIELKEIYAGEGFNMLPEQARFEDGGDGVWVGIMELDNLMATGRLKIASCLMEVFEEIRQYHTKPITAGEDQGKVRIVKIKDDLLDACFHPDTKVLTDAGPKRIIDIVGTTGKVVSLNGELQEYKNCRLTKRNAELVEITFSDGNKVKCTPGHRFLTVNGWVDAVHLHDENVIKVGRWKSISMGINTQDLVTTTERLISSCIGKYGHHTMGIFPINIISTTLTAIQKIMILKILNALRVKNIYQCITMSAKKKYSFAKNAGTNIKRWITGTIDFAAMLVSQSTGVIAVSMMKYEYVTGAVSNSQLINTQNRYTAGEVVIGKRGSVPKMGSGTLSVLRIESAPPSDVYCMEVENTHAFALSNGAIAHNCRYAYMMRRYAIRICDLNPQNHYIPSKKQGRDTRTGY